ncbi:hypothetical protein J6T66_04555 [bacterium]|nr:hypothetical protein [bacterium]
MVTFEIVTLAPPALVVVVFVAVEVFVVVVLVGDLTGIVKSGCALSINHAILFAFSSEMLMKISCP